MDERIEDEDVGGECGFDDHSVHGSADDWGGEVPGGLDGERVSEFVGGVGGGVEELGEEEEGEAGVRGGGVGADEGVEGVGVWVGDLVEHLEGVGEVGGGGERVGGEELGGVGEEAEAEHAGVDFL